MSALDNVSEWVLIKFPLSSQLNMKRQSQSQRTTAATYPRKLTNTSTNITTIWQAIL